ncbi:MAG: helix-turn-helix domain-containing protein [Treponema sp.]|nr:helix-turn-helix domain-containing protein [Treponema sp.]
MESLGNKLKTAREERSWTYELISRDTNISIRYLEALEKEDFSVFPGEAYALGFLKNYSEYLGLNSNELYSLYNSLKILEQPVPVEQLLRSPSQAPKIIRGIAISFAVLAVIAGVAYFIYRFPKRTPSSPLAIRAASEYTLTTDFLERRFYPGDSILVAEGNNAYKLVFSSLGDAITITTPRGQVVLDLGQEVTIDLSNEGYHSLRIIATDFVKNDAALGAMLRFEHEVPAVIGTLQEIPAETMSAARETGLVIFSSPNAFPFTLQAVFQGYCLFRYEVLFERDRQGRNEQYYQRSEEINVQAQNGIRLGISNAQAVKLQVMGGGRTVPFEAGAAGEVIAADLRWVRDEENRYRLVLLRLQ